MSRPTVIACMYSSSDSWELQQHPRLWHSRAGGGAVHSINSGHCGAGLPCPLCAKSRHCALRQEPPLFDVLVGAGEQRWRHFEVERLGGSQVDDEIEFGRLLYREISRSGTSQYPINIGDNWPTGLRNEVKRVLNQSAIGGRIEIRVDRGQSVPRVQLDDQLAIGEIEPLRRYDHATARFVPQQRCELLDLIDIMHWCHDRLHGEPWCRGLNRLKI